MNDTFGKDHLPFSESGINNGYHTSIHLQQVSAPVPITNPKNYPPIQPPTTVGYPQLFQSVVNDGFGTDSALFFKTGTLDVLKQLTSNVTPVIASTGITFLPGGLIMQWGIAGPSSSNITVTFATAFANNVFNIQLTRQAPQNSETDNKYTYWINGYAKDKFTIINQDAHTWSYFWVAIGN